MSLLNFLIQSFDCSLDVQEMKGGRTVLMTAIAERDWALVELLISCGANINVASHTGWFALDFVALTGNVFLSLYEI